MKKYAPAAAALCFAWTSLFGAAEQSAAAPQTAAAAQALAAVARDIRVSDARRAQLSAEVSALKNDEKALSRALAAAAAAERDLNRALRRAAARLADLEQARAGQSAVLAARRAELAEILAALERLGLNPPPAVLAQSEDAAKALRAAALLAALLPQLRQKTAQLQAEANRLAALQAQIKAEQQNLRRTKLEDKEEALRLKLLLAEKARSGRQKQRNLAEEEENRRNLAAKAQSLQDLLSKLSAAPLKGESSALPEPETKFSAMRGRLTLPAEGRLVSRFGQLTEGKPALGETFATAPGAAVLAPAEGIVRYAGAFRSYGQVLILDAGENYYLVLAGLAKIYAAPGRQVLQGEPVGVMETVLPADKAGYAIGKTAPRLYIEIRKDGKPADPALWWAAAAGAAPLRNIQFAPGVRGFR